MMNVTLKPKSAPHYPGALSDEAAALLQCMYSVNIWIPDFRTMSKAQIDGLAQLIHVRYIISSAWWGYRTAGRWVSWI